MGARRADVSGNHLTELGGLRRLDTLTDLVRTSVSFLEERVVCERNVEQQPS